MQLVSHTRWIGEIVQISQSVQKRVSPGLGSEKGPASMWTSKGLTTCPERGDVMGGTLGGDCARASPVARPSARTIDPRAEAIEHARTVPGAGRQSSTGRIRPLIPSLAP